MGTSGTGVYDPTTGTYRQAPGTAIATAQNAIAASQGQKPVTPGAAPPFVQPPQQTPTGQAAPPFATMTPGNSPAYGTQSPTMFGTGTYTAPLLPINDQAITGAPAQGANVNYGLNSVWDNLNKEVANAGKPAAGMVQAATGGPASFQAATGQAAQANAAQGGYATSQAAQGGYATAGPTQLSVAGNTIGAQGGLADTLLTQANGGGTSAADLQLKAGADQNLANQLAALGSQRGSTNAALAQRTLADQAAASGATLNQQMGIQRAQETQAAQQAAGGVLSAQGSQAAGINSTAAGLAQQTALANAANAQQSTLANTENAQQAALANASNAQQSTLSNTENAQQTALANAAAQNAMTGGNLSAINAASLGNAQLSQQTNLANLGATNQVALANQGAQLSNAQLSAQQLNAALGAQTGIGEANKAASLADQQLELQQLIAANQVNEQGYQASANANGNLTGAVISGVAGLGSTLLNAGLKSAAGAAAGAVAPANTGVNSGLWSGTQAAQNPASWYATSDENLKEGIAGGNPMMQSFLRSYRDATAPKAAINVDEGSRFRNPTFARSAAAGDAGGGGTGSGIGSILGGIAGTFLAPGIGTALGSAAGGAVGGAVGSGIDPGSAGAVATQQTSPGSGVTVDFGGIGNGIGGGFLDAGPGAGDDPSGTGGIRPIPPGVALSDENEKDAVTSGNRGMQAFLQQANKQTNAQNGQAVQSNAFMQRGDPLTAHTDTQMPGPSPSAGVGAQPPFMAQPGFAGASSPWGVSADPSVQGQRSGGDVTSGGITNYGGYQGAAMFPTAPQQTQSAMQAFDPEVAGQAFAGNLTRTPTVAPAAATPLHSAATNPLFAGALGTTYTPPRAPYNPGVLGQQPTFSLDQGASAMVPFMGGATALSDEREKTATARDPEEVQRMLDQLAAYSFKYKNPEAPGAMPGQRMGIMAQDLERSPLGRQFVRETPDGTKQVDFGSMAGTQLAASAMLNERLDRHESMLDALTKRKGARS